MDEPTLTIGLDGNVPSVDPATVPAGRVTVVGPPPDPAVDLLLTWELTPDQLADLERGRLVVGSMARGTGDNRLELTAGTHAAVAVDPTWTPPAEGWDGAMPVIGAARFMAAAADSDVAVRGDGGPVQVVGFLAATAIRGVAVFGLVLGASLARPRRRAEPGSDVRGGTTLAWVVTVVDAVLVGGLILLAIDLAHDPSRIPGPTVPDGTWPADRGAPDDRAP